MNGRIVLAAVLLLGGTGIAVAGASPQSTLTPSSAQEADAGQASVKGMIEETDERNRTFVLTDGEAEITVRMASTLPAAVQDGRSIVAKGELTHTDGSTALEADEVLIGCPSKYEA